MRPTRDGCTRDAWGRAVVAFIVFTILAAAMPLLGVASAGKSIAPYLEFPPTTAATSATPFNAAISLLLALAIGAALAPFAWRWWRTPRARIARTYPLPWWGWAGALLLAATWLVAWTRLPALADAQRFTFTPLWLGYIVVINALAYRRAGWCLLRDRPLYLASLFPLSAVFWWYFEYLNRFVRNWHYEGVESLSATQYIVEASLPFATVLPAVMSTAHWLGTFPRLQHAFEDWRPLRGVTHALTNWVVFVLAILGLFAIGRWPQASFPLVWVAPIGVLYVLQRFVGHQPLGTGLARGDWRPVVIPAIAALVCGFLWELWNYGSLARWVYTVPYVDGPRLFEMPLLGYAGYLPFGLACAAVVDLFRASCGTGENGVESRGHVPAPRGGAARADVTSPPSRIEVSHDKNHNTASADGPRGRRGRR